MIRPLLLLMLLPSCLLIDNVRPRAEETPEDPVAPTGPDTENPPPVDMPTMPSTPSGPTEDACHRQIPRTFFTDLVVAPRGTAWITIYGLRMGSCRGQAKITVGGTEVADYGRWQSDSAPRHLDRVVVRLHADTPLGSQTIVVHTASGDSSGLSINVVASARVRYAAPVAVGDGSSVDQPMALTAALSTLAAGDIVYLRGGDYTTLVAGCGSDMSGSDTAACVPSLGSSAGLPIAVVGYLANQEAVARLGAANQETAVTINAPFTTLANVELVSPASNWGVLSTAANTRLVGVEADGDWGSAGFSPSTYANPDGFTVLGSHVRNTKMFEETIDVRNGNNQSIAYSDVDGTFYVTTDTGAVTNLRIHHNRFTTTGIVVGSPAGSPTSVHVYDNLFLGGAHVSIEALGTYVLSHNLFYHEPLAVLAPSNDVRVSNNIFVANSAPYVTASTGITGADNLWNGGNTPVPSWDSRPTIGAAIFASEATEDFRPVTGSAVVDEAGAREDDDFLGRAQQGNACDIGPYEL